MDRYLALVREFSARAVLFHETIAGLCGLHATDLKALRLLGEEEMTAGRLAEHTGLTGAAVTALVDRLEASGYVRRERDAADRRRVTIRAVPAKSRALDQLYARYSVEMSKLLARYDAKEFAVIADYLEKATQLLAEETARLRDEGAKSR
jgi:DNA-binding MarR family transcriptional regulator